MQKTAKPTDPDHTAADAPHSEQSSPVGGVVPPDILDTLSAILRTGAMAAGVAVRVVQIELADDRVQRLELPVGRREAAAGRTRMWREVERVVDEMAVGDVLSYDELAKQANHGSNSGPFRKCVKGFAEESGRLEAVSKGFEKLM